MILIPLSVDSPLSHTIHFSISPLFELAASLHVLAQPVPPRRFLPWTEEVHRLLAESLLYTDWAYFRPLFHCGIPHVFDPVQSRGVESEEEQYNYLLSLSTPHVADSVQSLLKRCGPSKREPLAAELNEDPDYVKGRLMLFLSTYRQLCLEAKWKSLAPLYLEEAERIRRATEQLDSLLSYLKQIPAAISFDTQTSSLACQSPGPYRKAAQLLLCPSYFHFSPPRLEQTGTLVYVLYSMADR